MLSEELCFCLYLFPVPIINSELDGQWHLTKEITFAFLYLIFYTREINLLNASIGSNKRKPFIS